MKPHVHRSKVGHVTGTSIEVGGGDETQHEQGRYSEGDLERQQDRDSLCEGEWERQCDGSQQVCGKS